MRPDLMLPLDCLPGPVPVGAPVYIRDSGADAPSYVTGRAGAMLRLSGGSVGHFKPWCLLLDISAPPVDAQGWPLRIDGADVVAGMLARAMGKGMSGQFFAVGDLGYMLRGGLGQVAYLTHHQVSALATIDPADPDAARLALAAVMRARVWEVERG